MVKIGHVVQMAAISALTDLAALNNASAKVASFHVRLLYPQMIHYEYTERTTKKKKQGQYFSCRLVSKSPHSVEATLRGSTADLKAAELKYKHGANFLLKKISFDAKSSPCYIASNLKLCVDLKNTCVEACDDDTSIPASIGPRHGIKELLEISSRMAFDLVACCCQVGEPRDVDLKNGGTAQVCDVVTMVFQMLFHGHSCLRWCKGVPP